MSTSLFEDRPLGAREWARFHAAGGNVELFEAAFDRFAYERHFHDAYAIGVTLSGVQRFRCRGTTHDSVPGDVLVIPPGETHDGESGTRQTYSYRMLYVAESKLLNVAGDVLERPMIQLPLRAAPLLHDATTARRIDAAWRAARANPTSLAAEELLDSACVRLIVCDGESRVDRRVVQRAALIRVRDYLQANLGKRVSMGELATIAAMSRFHLTRQFQRQFGLPLHAYHLQLRLQEARRLLKRGEPISAIAINLGFVDQSHLHRRFKAAFGVTPGAWRAAMNGGSSSLRSSGGRSSWT
jgi:AraC-like DNA-binding protein